MECGMEPTDHPQQSAHGDENQLFNNVNAGGDINVGNRVGRDQIGRDQFIINVQDPQQAAEISRILRWNWPTPLPFANYRSFRSQGFVGRQWLFDAVRDWAMADLSSTETPQALLIGADYGVGKSAFLARLVETEAAGVPIIAQHFCQHDVIDTLSPGRFVTSLAAQLAAGLPEYKAIIEAESASSLRELLSNPDSDPVGALVQSVLEPLAKIAAPVGPRLLVIDALDEALDYRGSGGRDSTIVSLLAADRAHRFPRWLRLLATSRRLPAVQRPLRQAFSLKDINTEQEENLGDIRRYAIARCEQEPLATRLAHADLRADEVAAALIEEGRSGGKFLYAALVLNDIANGELQLRQPGDLETLPVGMEEFYKQTFQRRFPNDATFEPVRELLAVHAVQRAPLSRRELTSILARPESLIKKQHHQLHDLLRMSKSDPAYEPGEVLAGFDHPSLSRWLTSIDEWGYMAAGRFAIDRERAEAVITRWALAEVEANRAHTWPYLVRHLDHHLPREKRPDVLAKLLRQFAWLEARLRLVGISALLEDLTTVQKSDHSILFPSLGHVIRQAAHVLMERVVFDGSAQLASQLLARQTIRSSAEDEIREQALDWIQKTSSSVPLVASMGQRDLVGTILTGSPVNSLAILPNDLIAAGLDDFTIRVWDLNTGNCTYVLKGHTAPVNALAVLNDGRLASGSDDMTIRIWNLVEYPEDHQLVFAGHEDSVRALEVLPSGWIASGSSDGSIKLWDPESSDSGPLVTLEGHSKHVISLVALPDDQLASASFDKTIRLWSLRNYLQATVKVIEFETVVISLALLPNGCLLSGLLDRTIRMSKPWNPATSQVILSNFGKWLSLDKYTPALYALSDGRLAYSSGRNVFVFKKSSTHSLKQIVLFRNYASCICYRSHQELVTSLAETHNGLLISGSADSTIRIWKLRTGSFRDDKHDDKLCGSVNSIAKLSDGRIAYGSTVDSVRMADPRRPQDRHQRLPGSSIGILSLASLRDGRLVTCSWKQILVLDAQISGNRIRYRPRRPPIRISAVAVGLFMSVAVMPSGVIAVGTVDGSIRLLANSNQRYDLSCILNGHTGPVSCLFVLPNGLLVSGSADGDIRIWDTKTFKCVNRIVGSQGPVKAISVLAEGLIASASNVGSGHKTYIWDPFKTTCLATFESHHARLLCMYSTEANELFIGCSDGTLRKLDLGSQASGYYVSFVADAAITALQFLPTRSVMVAGDATGKLHWLQIPRH